MVANNEIKRDKISKLLNICRIAVKSNSMVSEYPKFPNISQEKIKSDLLPELLEWSLANGLAMYPPDFKPEETTTAPTTLFPTPLPKNSFREAIEVQRFYNELYAKISQDGNERWLSKETEKLAKFDPEFTGRLWNLHLEAQRAGISQKLALGVFRSDYLIDSNANQIKQVEFNTVSVSFGGLSTKVGELHKFFNESGKYSDDGSTFYTDEIPVSESAELLAKGLWKAVEKYDTDNNHTVVAFIVQQGERNVFDQRALEYNLFKNYGVKSVRITIHEIHKKTRMDQNSKRLFLTSTGEEISLVYFRAGYSPSDFITEQDWENRLMLETSYAIKAPNLLTQLSGTKKIQQLLTDESLLSKFVPQRSIRQKLLPTFVKIYPLDDTPLGQEAKKLATESPENFVLKPQREGGGNNIYKEDIPAFLKTLKEEDWSAYILMELINPMPTSENIIIRGQDIYKEPMLSELGIFGYVLFDDSNVYDNEYAGWLLRSKFSSSNEGGVAAGFGCVDSVVLY